MGYNPMVDYAQNPKVWKVTGTMADGQQVFHYPYAVNRQFARWAFTERFGFGWAKITASVMRNQG